MIYFSNAIMHSNYLLSLLKITNKLVYKLQGKRKGKKEREREKVK